MRRDLPTILRVLERLEAAPADARGLASPVGERELEAALGEAADGPLVRYQIRLLARERYVNWGGSDYVTLTWKGHDLLDTLRTAREAREFREVRRQRTGTDGS